MRVEGPVDAVRDVLAAVPGVQRLEPADGDATSDALATHTANRVCAFITHSAVGDPVRQAIAAAVVGRGWGLIEVRPLPLSLEDLFVRLVTREEATRP